MIAWRMVCFLMLAGLAFGFPSAADVVSDTGGPLGAGAVAVAASTTQPASGPAAVPFKAETPQASSSLRKLIREQRVEGTLFVELPTQAQEHDRVVADRAESLWRSGEYERAVSDIELLEQGGVFPALSLAWDEPIPSGSGEGVDVRIGTATGAEAVVLDFHRSTQNLFALVDWDGGWSVHISTDGGSSWNETYFWFPDVLCDMTVVGDYVYVSYAFVAASEWRLRRLSAATGAVDSVYGFLNYSIAPGTVGDIVTGGNQDSFDNRIYVGLIQNDDEVRFFWDDAAIATAFSERSPGRTDGAGGLAFSWNPMHYGERNYMMSYIGTDNRVHIVVRTNVGWQHHDVGAYTGTNLQTSISAYADNIFCSYDEFSSPDFGIKYSVSYNGGTSWGSGVFLTPGVNFGGSAITARSGVATAMFHSVEEGEPDSARWRLREGFQAGAWPYEQQLSDHDLLTGLPTDIEWLAPIQSHGVAYIDGSVDNIPYFDNDLWYSPIIFIDRFESGDGSYWGNVVP